MVLTEPPCSQGGFCLSVTTGHSLQPLFQYPAMVEKSSAA